MKTKSQEMTSLPRLGLDFGRVIMGAVQNGKADTSFLGSSFEDAMKSPATDGAFEAVAELVDLFAGEVWIVSKCGPSVEQKTRGWLRHHDFYGRTSLSPEKVLFCRKRPEKAPICARLGITHFVDDRIDVLFYMVGTVPQLFLFGEQAEGQSCPDYAIAVPDWESVLEVLEAGLLRA